MTKKKSKAKPVKFTWHGHELRLVKEQYNDGGRIAVIAMSRPSDSDDFDPEEFGINYDPQSEDAFCEQYAVISVNLPDAIIPEGCVAFKTWSENDGLLEELIAQKLVEPPITQVRTGYAIAPVCKILF